MVHELGDAPAGRLCRRVNQTARLVPVRGMGCLCEGDFVMIRREGSRPRARAFLLQFSDAGSLELCAASQFVYPSSSFLSQYKVADCTARW